MRMMFILCFLVFINILLSKGEENTADYWAEKGIALVDKDAYPEAAECFDKAISLNQSNFKAWYGKGICLQYEDPKNPHHAEAVMCFERAIKINSTYAEAYMDMSWSLAVLGLYDEAFLSADRAIELMPNNSDALNVKGAIFFEMHKFDKAQVWFEKAIKADPKNADAWYNMGTTYAKQDPDDSRASVALEKAKELDRMNE